MDLNEFDELIGLNAYRSDAGRAFYGLRNEVDALDAPCTCPMVREGSYSTGPDEYEPDEDCLLHGIGAPHSAFSAGAVHREPRVWVTGDYEPGDCATVADRDGDVWKPIGEGRWLCTGIGTDIPWPELARIGSPLTEVEP